jgi:tRNA(Ile)-lysidine synthase
MSMRRKVVDAVVRSELIEPGERVLALLSGGADSVCLVHSLREVLGAGRLKALHVNHALRAAADEDERFCRELCAELALDLVVERVEVPSRGNLEAAAREARYGAAERVREQLGLDLVATGHTAGDQVETILYRLASSPSRRALLGMRPRDGRLVRPLLGATRAETTAYCEERGLAWRDDGSNEEADYKRNLIRRGLIPELERVHPAARENVLRTAALLREEAELLDSLVDAELEAGEGTISQRRFAELHPALRRLVLQRLADEAAGRPVAGAARFAEQVAGLTRGGSALDLGGGVRAVLARGVLRAERS